MKTLRPYLVDAIEAVRRTLATHASGVLVLPTGTGKTVVMAKLANEWPGGNVLFLAHRVELLDQAAAKLEEELGYPVAVEQADRGTDREYLWQGGYIIVASVQTMMNERRLAKFDPYPFDLIMVDECHHATAPSYRKIIDYFLKLNPHCKVLGVTATPRRADNTALGLVFESVAYNLGIGEAIDDGWLVPIRQEYVAVEGVDFDHIGTGKNELGESDLKAAELEQVLVEEEALHSLATPIREKSQGRKTLVFTAGVHHAHMLAGVLNRYEEGCAAAIDGTTLKQVRTDAVENFRTGKLKYLCNYAVFTEGFDVPPCAVIAMGRPTKSLSLYTQMLGRGTRPLDGVVDGYDCSEDRKMSILRSDKPHMLVLDFVGNSRHTLVSSVDVLGGNYDVETRELAARQMREHGGDDVQEQLKKAALELERLREEVKQRRIRAKVNYSTEDVDPFSRGVQMPGMTPGKLRGGRTDKQVAFLINFGVQPATAWAYNKRQASAVIENYKATRCTVNQRKKLEEFGEDPNVNFATASAILDMIAQNGWRPRTPQQKVEMA
jgi:superfamily II DNA or RNA helicase